MELIFIDLRDRSGVVQVVFNPDISAEALAIAEKIRNEYVIDIQGTVINVMKLTVNPNVQQVKLKFKQKALQLLNEAKTPPFVIEDKTEVSEDVRLKYRYLDLRRPAMFETLKMRNQITKAIRDFLDGEGFLKLKHQF